MEREILFRGKRVDNGKWIKGCYQKIVVYGTMEHFILPSQAIMFDDVKLKDILIKIIPETVGQLWMRIGDLNLFDGDVFNFTKYDVQFVIQFNQRRSQFCIAHPDEIGLKYINPWHCPDEKWIEEYMKDAVCVGNIHDNPDLLK